MNNYIKEKLDQKIKLLKGLSKKEELKIHLQSKLEFYFILILSYLWNKNINKVQEETKEEIINTIINPSIGSIISVIRLLDIENEFFNNKNLKKVISSINSYPSSRNNLIGHGYSFEDNTDKFITLFENYIDDIESADNNIILGKVDFIYVSNIQNNIYSGINYKSNGNDYVLWNCSDKIEKFQIGSLYAKNEKDEYFRISPFINIEDDNSFYIFCSIEEKLTGRVKFNQLLRTGNKKLEFEEFAIFSITEDSFKKKSSNGTIINKIENNFTKYIGVGPTKILINFLTQNQSSVFATLWGHGGIGKTATAQNVCEILTNHIKKKFDYIVFTSAKDRYYNYYKGIIQEVPNSLNSYEDIIVFCNKLIFNQISNSEENLIKYSGKILLIIDDFETFNKDEKDKIIEFIKKLNINNHKVILTTRSATLITGEEIECNELDIENTYKFLLQAYENEFPDRNIDEERKLFDLHKEEIHGITSGRPLFILQFAILLAQKGSIEETLDIDIKSTENATKFLYDRIFEYLSNDAKNMFLAINLLVDSNDLTGTVQNLKFILNKEDVQNNNFEQTLNELIKLKIIELIDKEIFKVYSAEILVLMRHYYENKTIDFDPQITNRYTQISTGKRMSTDFALLRVADSSRYTANDATIENQYRNIIKRETAKEEIRVKALLNYAEFLSNQKNDIDKTIKLFSDFSHWFSSNTDFVIMHARYLWAEGSFRNRNQSVKLLDDYLSSRPKIEEEVYLQILGIHLHYATYNLVTERDSLKDKKRFREIDNTEYRRLYDDQRDRFLKLFHYPGLKLYGLIKKRNLMDISSKPRTNILEGLSNLVEICIRLNKHEQSFEICNKIINEMPIDYHRPFQSKVERLNNIVNKSENEIEINYPETELSVKLREALENTKK
ncbi:NB-ARC domain-containing protein [Elizabethkingia anophelis]|uniref:NB-ARC domain-containing protein n=1 Tax=Elizabethkingia anophelis TaxID=1117645 RepID=UPI00083FDFC9|nr:NB-ARC domain-containing protein [Elizabethkingia anophelis]OCW73617.1 hypothetical protein A4G24_00315 [Elizabethkingia anophelis]